MNRIKRLAAALMTVILAVSLTGCDVIDRIKKEFASSEPVTTGSTVQDGNLLSNSISVGILDFDTFNPLITKSQTVKECMEFIYEPLFDVDELMRPVPILAESYSVSPDGRTVNINLRNNILWHDGANFKIGRAHV